MNLVSVPNVMVMDITILNVHVVQIITLLHVGLLDELCMMCGTLGDQSYPTVKPII